MKKLWLFLVLFSSLLQGMEAGTVDVETGLMQPNEKGEAPDSFEYTGEQPRLLADAPKRLKELYKRYPQYMSNAALLLKKVNTLREYEEDEVSKTFKYFQESHPTTYGIFLEELALEKPDVDELTIQFLKLMHKFRETYAKDRKKQKIELEGVVEKKEEVIKKDKWWKGLIAIISAVTGAVATLAPILGSQAGDAVEAACNCTMAAM